MKESHVQAIAKALEGNTHARKLTTPELKQEAYRQYCEHIAQGYSKKSFCFEHPDIDITWETMDKYMAESPSEFPPVKMVQAKSRGLKVWENVVADGATGRNKDASAPILQMKMRNQFGWDKREEETAEQIDKAIEKLNRMKQALKED